MIDPLSTWVAYEGCGFTFEVRGSGPPVVFIQGVGIHGQGWKPVVDELADEFQCLVFDNRGMGESTPVGAEVTVEQMAEDTVFLMQHLGWDSAHVVGHSLGGAIALELALMAPRKVRSLALLNTFASGAEATKLSREMLWLGLRSKFGLPSWRRKAFLEIILPKAVVAAADTEALAAEYAPLFGHDLADQPAIVTQQLEALRAFDASKRLALIETPTLVVSAAHDPIAPPASGRVLADGIANAQYIEVPDASHGLPIQFPVRIKALLRKHFHDADTPRPGDLSR